MERPTIQISVALWLGVVACVALNIWLFRVSIFLGIVGLNVTKHVVIAWLCQVLGVNRRKPAASPALVKTVPNPGVFQPNLFPPPSSTS